MMEKRKNQKKMDNYDKEFEGEASSQASSYKMQSQFQLMADEAEETSNEGMPCIGITYDGGVLLAGVKKKQTKLVDANSVQKVYRINVDNASAAYSGHMGDAERLVEVAQYKSANRKLKFKDYGQVREVAKDIEEVMHSFGSVQGYRPFHCRLLVGGFDEEGPQLYEIESTGNLRDNAALKAAAIGMESNSVLTYFEENYVDNLSREDAEKLAFDAFDLVENKVNSLADDADHIEISPTTLDFTRYDDDGFTRYTTQEIEASMVTAKSRKKQN